MATRYQLREYTDTDIDLPKADISMLMTELAGRVNVTPVGSSPGYKLNPGSYVGVVRLPSGAILDLLPKVNLYNVMWMLSEVEKLEGMHFNKLPRTVEINTFDGVLEPIAQAFADQVDDLIHRGLYRTYVDQEENLTAIRGRIDFAQDVRHNLVLRHRTYCRFTELSWDVPENQVIRQVVHLLAGWRFSHRLTSQLMALDRTMEDIRRTRMQAEHLDRFHYSRSSEHYRGVHRFCRLFLDGFSLSEDIGDSPFDGFLIDMNTLFEQFVALKVGQYLEQRQSNWRLERQFAATLDVGDRVNIRPDLVLTHHNQYRLVGDTKYKLLKTDEHKNQDLYQMIAYCTVLGVETGLLVYPKHLLEFDVAVQVRNSPIRIHEVSIDLQDSREAIEAEIARLALRMLALGTPGIAAVA